MPPVRFARGDLLYPGLRVIGEAEGAVEVEVEHGSVVPEGLEVLKRTGENTMIVKPPEVCISTRASTD